MNIMILQQIKIRSNEAQHRCWKCYWRGSAFSCYCRCWKLWFPSHLLFPFVFQLHCGRSISVWAQGSEGGFRCHEGIEKGSTEGCQETVMGSVVSHLGISTFGQACQSGELREEGSNNGKWTEGKSRDLRSSVCSCQNPWPLPSPPPPFCHI